jgi:hypothetical protein
MSPWTNLLEMKPNCILYVLDTSDKDGIPVSMVVWSVPSSCAACLCNQDVWRGVEDGIGGLLILMFGPCLFTPVFCYSMFFLLIVFSFLLFPSSFLYVFPPSVLFCSQLLAGIMTESSYCFWTCDRNLAHRLLVLLTYTQCRELMRKLWDKSISDMLLLMVTEQIIDCQFFS